MSDLTRRIHALEKAVRDGGDTEIFVYLIDGDRAYFTHPDGTREELTTAELERRTGAADIVIRVRYED